MKFNSKKDRWLVWVLWASVIGMLFAGYQIWTSPAPHLFRMGMGLLMLISAGFVLWVLYFTRYCIEGNLLLVYCGPFRWRVPLGTIEAIRPSRNPLSGPACSLDRLHIKYSGSRFGVLVSPEDQDLFLEAIAAKAPHLVKQGDQLLRK